MRNLTFSILSTLAFATPLFCVSCLAGQESSEIPHQSVDSEVVTPFLDRAFSATKYARLVRVLPDGSLRFVRNERYPSRIARDTEGRIMMQHFGHYLSSECDRPTMRVPPPCPSWDVFVVDLHSQLVTHWSMGELAGHVAVAMPLSQEHLELATRLTSEMPTVEPQIEDDATSVIREDLGEQVIDGIRARGGRTTITYPVGHLGSKLLTTQIHEIWIAPEMRLIVRMIDGDPHGLERIWGLEKISLHPEPSLFFPPPGYEMQHQKSDAWAMNDFEQLESWFEK
jgi:hypothetical protein